MNILDEAKRVTAEERQVDYGHPIDDFTRIAALWSKVLGAPVTPEQVALCMIQVKVSRLCHAYKEDSVVDIAGYARTLQQVHEALTPQE